MHCTACSRVMLCESTGVGEPMLTSTSADGLAAGTEDLPPLAVVALPGVAPDEQPAATTATHSQTAHHRFVMSIRVSALAAGSRHRRAANRREHAGDDVAGRPGIQLGLRLVTRTSRNRCEREPRVPQQRSLRNRVGASIPLAIGRAAATTQG
jgi:hypothetical protein